MTLVVCTAGHIDHGKTSLAFSLTGYDTDRLAEEKRRGISIELGFAPLQLPSGRPASLIDVPGHERFVRQVVAGASGVDAAVLCVAADDGVMPQTLEHCFVLRLLGVTRMVVAVTRSDLADPGPACAAVRSLVGTQVPIVAVSTVTGAGLPALLHAIDEMLRSSPRRQAAGPARLYIDRVFTAPGTGTVVTGTLWGAALAVGDRVRVLPGRQSARVRALQVHEVAVERVDSGRAAVALAGIRRDEVSRGLVVVDAHSDWEPSRVLLVELRAVRPGQSAALKFGRRVQVLLGTSESHARCEHPRREWGASLNRSNLVALRLERPLLALRGDQLVLRSSPQGTVAGAVVLETGQPSALSTRPKAARPREARPQLSSSRSSRRNAAESPLLNGLRGALLESGLHGTPEVELVDLFGDWTREGLYTLRRADEVRVADGRWFIAIEVERAIALAQQAFAAQTVTIAQLRDLWQVGRRSALGLAALMDSAGVSTRRGDHRQVRQHRPTVP